jgi:hypothetical protein
MAILKRKYLLYLLLFPLIIAFQIHWINQFKTREANKKRLDLELINELKSKSNLKLQSIKVLPDQLSNKDFSYEIKEPELLVQFSNSLALADNVEVKGHSSTLYKSLIILRFENGEENKYRATIFGSYENQSNHLFLTNSFFYLAGKENGKDFYKQNIGGEARIPNMGPWLYRIAPKGHTIKY